MPRQRLARFRAGAGDDIEHTRRQARVQAQLRQAKQRQRGVFGRLEHHRIASRQGRRDLPGTDHQRKVPGHDGPHHANRLLVDQAQRAFWRGGDLAVDLVDTLGVITEGARRAARLGLPGHGDLGAVVAHAQHRQFGMVRLDAVGDAVQNFLALCRRHARPHALLKTAAGRLHRAVDVHSPGSGDAAKRLPVDRRDHGQGLARRCRLPLSFDQQTLVGNGQVTQCVDVFLFQCVLPKFNPSVVSIRQMQDDALLRRGRDQMATRASGACMKTLRQTSRSTARHGSAKSLCPGSHGVSQAKAHAKHKVRKSLSSLGTAHPGFSRKSLPA